MPRRSQLDKAIDDLYATVRHIEAEKCTALKEFDARIAGVRESISQLERQKRSKPSRKPKVAALPVAAGQ